MAGKGNNDSNGGRSKRSKGSGGKKKSEKENRLGSTSLRISSSKKSEDFSQEVSSSDGPSNQIDHTAGRAPVPQLLTAPALSSSSNPVAREAPNIGSISEPLIPKSRRAPYNGKDNVQDYDPEKLDEALTGAGSFDEPEGAPLSTQASASLAAGGGKSLNDSFSETHFSTSMEIDELEDSGDAGELLATSFSPGSTDRSSASRKRDFESFKTTLGNTTVQLEENSSRYSIPRKPVANNEKQVSETPKELELGSSSQARRAHSPLDSPGTPITWGETRRLEAGEPRMSLGSMSSASLKETTHSDSRRANENLGPAVLSQIDCIDKEDEILSIEAQMEDAMASFVGEGHNTIPSRSSSPEYLQSEEECEEADTKDGEANIFVHPIERKAGDGLGAHRILTGKDHPSRVRSGQPIPLQIFTREQQEEQIASKRRLDEKMKLRGHKLDPAIEKSLRTKENAAIRAFRQYSSTRKEEESVQLGLAAVTEALEDGLGVASKLLSAEYSILQLRNAGQKAIDMVQKLSAEKNARMKADKEDPDFKDRDNEITKLRKRLEDKDNNIRQKDADWAWQVRQLESELKDAKKTKDALETCLENNRDKEETIGILQNALSGGRSYTKAGQTKDSSSIGRGENEQSQGGPANQASDLENERILLETIVSGIQANSKGYTHIVLKTSGSLVVQLKRIEYYIDKTLQQFQDAEKETSNAKQTLDTINTHFGFGRLLNVQHNKIQSSADFRYKYHSLSEIIEELVLRISDWFKTAARDVEQELEATKTELASLRTEYKGIDPDEYRELGEMLKQEKRNAKSLEENLAKSTTVAEFHRKDAAKLRREVVNLEKEVRLGEEICQHDKTQLETDVTKLKKLLDKARAEKAVARERQDSGFSVNQKVVKPTQLAIEFALIRCDAALKAMVNKRMVYGFEYGDSEEAVDAALLATKLSEKRGDEVLAARSSFWAGVSYYYSDDVGTAMLQFKNAQKSSKWREPKAERKMLDLWLQGGANLPVPKDASYYGGKPGSLRRSSTDLREGKDGRRRKSRKIHRVKPLRKASSGKVS